MKTLRNILLFLVINTNISLADSPYVWNLLDSGFHYFMKVENIDSLNLMLLENKFYAYKYLYHSTDGGYTWDTIYKDPERIQYGTDLAYPTKDFIIFTANAGFENDAGIYVRSTDGGKTWKETRTNYYDTVVGYRDVRMYDDKHGVISGNFHMIVSHDGFETWDSVKFHERFRIVRPEMISSYTIYSVAVSGLRNKVLFIKSNDGGETWKEYNFPYPESESKYVYIQNIKFLDSLFGYAIGGDQIGKGATTTDLIFRTTDGGETWKLVLDTSLYQPYGLSNLDILDRNNAIFVGMGGKIYWTADGGDSFIYDSNATIRYKGGPNTIYVTMLGEHTAVIVGGNGRIFRSSLATGVGDNQPPLKNYLAVSPNPATDYIEVTIPPLDSGPGGVVESVRVYDVLGAEHPVSYAATPLSDGNIRLDVSGLAPGVYFVSVGGIVQKFVKM